MFTFTDAGQQYLLETLFITDGVQFCLAIDADLTEVTDEAYSRIELDEYMETSGDLVTNVWTIALDAGEQVASHWFVTDPTGEIPVLYGQLPSPISGAVTFPSGGLLAQAVAG